MSKGNVLITGVSTGIGFYATRRFIAEGYTVYGSVRKKEDAERLEAKFGEAYRPLIFDVTDEEMVQQAARVVESEIADEGLQLLVNNSGMAVTGPSQCLSTADFRKQFEVNFLGLVSVTNAFLPLLGAKENSSLPPGKIINISSVAAKSGMPYMTPYGSSKAAVDAYSEGLRRELMLFGIDVVVFNPGPIKTPIWDKVEEPEASMKESPYGPSLLRFLDLSKREAAKAIPVEEFCDQLFEVFQKKKAKTFYLVIRDKWTKFIIPRLLFSDRAMDRLMFKVLKMKR
ncbi:SDR family NAD(P)-dependent oxidoreductase [Reichenbachiella ulvae]|uniref:SDR family NAD(P)-dependent oxidoreductase n=1 Tax=Reichenbachiella ulvae TaxID=2980104 RepID=A0ABT3CTG2_9BACT|nr:SDR family NAD(P)-dependent oxidoreductase [Reichenbachiella ulvae]MCV9386909.1 SDR family NAD(P)-dependent oxidoreductase [Reichenbachiella ulvae]